MICVYHCTTNHSCSGGIKIHLFPDHTFFSAVDQMNPVSALDTLYPFRKYQTRALSDFFWGE